MACKFCNISNYNQSYYDEELYIALGISDLEVTSIGISYDKKRKKFELYAIGDEEVSTEIGFCPFCGRNLSEE